MAGKERARVAVGLTVLETLKRDHPELVAEVRAKLHETTRKEFDTVATLRWVSMRSHMDLCDRVRDAVGQANNEDFWKRTAGDLLERPILGFVKSFAKLMGSPPSVYARVTPVIMSHLFQNVGTFSVRLVEGEDHFGVCSYRGFPASKHALMCFVEGVSGSLVTAGRVLGLDVEMRRLFVDPAGDFDLAVATAGTR